MTNYTYSRAIAFNPNTSPVSVAKSATGSVYAIADTTFTTALNMTLVVGGSVVTSISTDPNGIFPDFTLLDRTSCVWKQTGVSFATVLTTSDPVPGPQGNAGTTGAPGAQGVPGDVSTWKPTTFYPLNTPVTNPSGDLVICTTAHTSTGSYDAAKFTTAYDSAVQTLVNTSGTATQVALSATYSPLNVGGKLAVRKGELFINVKDYGAVGDGVVDDTSALQSWLNAGGTRLTNGTYRITAALTVTGDNRTVITDNAKILADSTNIKALIVSGNRATIRVNIDGNNKANYGISVTGSGALVEHCLIENIYAAADTARGVDVITTGGCIIRHNIIRNVNSVGDATSGNNIGAARAIILTAATAATVKSVISNNVIDGIIGEEGDAIQVLFTNYVSAKATVSDNKISNVSRRFIKIQAADCQVLRNTLTHNGSVPALPANGIDLISSSNVLIEGNDIGPHPLLVSISCSGTVGSPNLNNVIKNNTIRQADDKAYISVYFTYVNESAIVDNVFHGGSYASSIGNCVGVLVSNNVHFGGNTANPSFSANGTNTGVVMRNNVNMASARVTTASNASASGLTEYNSKRP